MESNRPLLSITCIAYNQEPYIADAIESFIAQKTSFPSEILIGDDCSTDRTRDIILDYQRRYPGRIRLIPSSKNTGSRLNGVQTRAAARGKYIAHCDGDDFWTDPLKLQAQVDFLESNPDYVVCHHDAVIIDETGNVISSSKLPDDHKRDFSSDELKKAKGMLTISLCFRNVMQNYPEEYFRAFNGDTFLTCLLGPYGKAKYMDRIRPAVYRKHRGGVWGPLSDMEKGIRQADTYAWLYRYYTGRNEQVYADYFCGAFKQMLSDWLLNYLQELSPGDTLLSSGFFNGTMSMKNHRFCPDLIRQLETMIQHNGSDHKDKRVQNGGIRFMGEDHPTILPPADKYIQQAAAPMTSSANQRIALTARTQRILLVNHNIAPYEHTGTPLSTLSHARGMKARGLEVSVLIPDPSVRNGVTKILLNDIPLYKMPKLEQEETFFSSVPAEALRQYQQIIHFVLQDFRPDVVHINDYVFMPSAIIHFFSRAGIPVVRNVCNTEEICYRIEPVLCSGRDVNLCKGPEDMDRCAECYCRSKKIDLADAAGSIRRNFSHRFQLVQGMYESEVSAVIFTTAEFKEYFTSFIPIREEKIRVIPRGFSFPHARPSRPIRVEGNIVKFGFLGSGIPRKGIDVILRAVEKLPQKQNFELHVYGDIGHEPFAGWIDELNKKHGHTIHCHGAFAPKDLPKIASEIHCAIVPSYFETYNRVVREMLWSGVPVIATDFFGSSIIQEGINGHRIASGDSNALANRMSRLIEDPHRNESLSCGALQTPIPSLDDEIEGLLKVYRDLSATPQPRSLGNRPQQDEFFGNGIDWLSYLDTTEPLRFSTLYVDTGDGFNEEQSLKRSLPGHFDNGPVSLEFNVRGFTNIRTLRFDPIENAPAGIDVVSVVLKGRAGASVAIPIGGSNAVYACGSRFVFSTHDPALYLSMPEGTDDAETIQLVLKYSVGQDYVGMLERVVDALSKRSPLSPLHAKLYIDTGHGYTENNSLIAPLPLVSGSGVATLTFPLSGIDPIMALRLDPIENAVAIVEVNKIELRAGSLVKSVRVKTSNAAYVKNNRYAFMDDDPAFHLEMPGGMKHADSLVVELKYFVKDAYVNAIGDIVAEAVTAHFMKNASGQRYISKLYVDHGSGFIEGDALVLELPCDPKTGRIGLDIDLKPYGKIKALRWDPIEHAMPVVELNQLHVYRKGEPIRASVTGTNAKSVCDNILIFASDDPYLEITLPADMPSADRLHVEYRVLVRNN
jgi:glycosyltransferase involved in cell wall biosynthesis